MGRFVFVTGGVLSSLGKGIASASLGMLLKSRGLGVTLMKFDPYINVDPGTMNPFQHGEVYVTADGAETDLDLGHYERFVGVELSRDHNATAGQVYDTIISRERRGDFLGGTVQVIPHVTDEIKSRIRRVGEVPGVDVAVIEIGGTVGDIESLPFLEAIRQLRLELGRERTVFVHLTLVPFIRAAQELKTKPTQHSVRELMEIGIQADILLCRTDRPLTRDLQEKIALFCNVAPQAVVDAGDVPNIYEVPLRFREGRVDELVIRQLGVEAGEPQIAEWEAMVNGIYHPQSSVEIAVCGKYVHLRDAYKSIAEALGHGGIAHRARVDIRWVDAEEAARDGPEHHLAGVSGILVPGGFGDRGIEGKVEAIRYARRRDIPFLGICLGMQCAVIEIARDDLGLRQANSSEFDPATPDPVIDLMEDQRGVRQKGATMRLGNWPCHLEADTIARSAYETQVVEERHRHRYEFNNRYRDALTSAGVVFSGLSPDGHLVEVVELREQRWFVGCQFHPEFNSRPQAAHPLFQSFVGAALELRRQRAGEPVLPSGASS